MDVAVSQAQRRIDLPAEQPFRVGGTSMDPASREAVFKGGKERLQPQNLKVLIALARRKGEVVTRDDLVELCWGARFVGDDVINRAISTLRQFAERAGGFEIETVPRSGYRLVEMPGAPVRTRRWWPAIALGAALLIGIGGWSLQQIRGKNDSSPPTVAVLPLVEDSPGSDVHEFAAATRNALSDALTQGGYPVALIEQRAADRQPDLQISGHIQRTPSSVQALVQVEDTHHGVTVLSHRFEADGQSAHGLPDQIGAWVAANLSWAATLMMLDRRHPSDPAITAELLNDASLEVDGGDKLRAYEVARQAALKAPNSALAQFVLASEAGDAFGELPRDQRAGAVAAGRRAADRLLVLAPDFGDAYGLWCGLHNPLLIGQCEDHLRRGLRIDPAASIASNALGMILNAAGRVDESLELAQVSLANDPLNPFKLARLIRVLEEEGDTRHADRLFRQSIRWWPNHPVIYWSRLVGIEARGDYAELERFASEIDEDKLPLNRDTAAKVIAAARAHDHDRISRACRPEGLRWTTQFLCMTALADAGDLDDSFAIANGLFPSARGRNAADEDGIWLDQPGAFSIAMLSSPAAASLRRDPRFLAVADGSGLVAYWRSGRLPDFCRAKPEPICASFMRRSAWRNVGEKE